MNVDRRLFWSLNAFLALVFLTGGGSRGDIQSLIILRPLAVFACGVGLLSLQRRHVSDNKFLFGFAAALLALPLLQLVPLPTSIWRALPGRDILVSIDSAAGLGAIKRPISFVPFGTWNAFYSLFVPLAVLLIGVQLSTERLKQLLNTFLIFGIITGILGLVQTAGSPSGSLYFYRITNNGTAVGLFANRNHQALLLASLLPMLAAFASLAVRSQEVWKLRRGFALLLAVSIVPLLLVTGSRLGLAAGVIGLVASIFIYRTPTIENVRRRGHVRLWPRYAAFAFGLFLLSALTILSSRAESVQRIIHVDPTGEERLQFWGPIWDMALKYFPIGSGVGTFPEVYQIDEPLKSLLPTYLNHAHNDWLEVLFVAGLPGALLLLTAVASFFVLGRNIYAISRFHSNQAVIQKLGAVIILILAAGSISDYPLRVPSLQCLFVVAVLWMRLQPDLTSRARRESIDLAAV